MQRTVAAMGQENLSFTKYASWLSRADLRILAGLLIGHADLNRHLTPTQIPTDAVCLLCQEDEEAVLHLLGECSTQRNLPGVARGGLVVLRPVRAPPCFIIKRVVGSGVMCLLRLSDLVMRFEAPDSRNRWDSPVFTVHPTDSIPFDQVYQVLYHRLPAPPNLSTLPVSIKRLLPNNIY